MPAKRPPSSLTSGVFGLTPNPIYLAMMLLYVGLAFVVNSPWMLLIAVPTGSTLCWTAIRPEQRYLEGKSGDVYRRYSAAVPRWI